MVFDAMVIFLAQSTERKEVIQNREEKAFYKITMTLICSEKGFFYKIVVRKQ